MQPQPLLLTQEEKYMKMYIKNYIKYNWMDTQAF
jgi:hypothetical protein